MTNNKISRIDKDIQKTREKIAEYQNRLKELQMQKTEAENLEIVQMVRSMRLTPQELSDLLKSDPIPGIATVTPDEEEKEDRHDEA